MDVRKRAARLPSVGLLIMFLCSLTDSESIPTWTWLDGLMAVNQTTELTPSREYPGARLSSAVWTDTSVGIVWMFGGQAGTGGLLSELWQYNVSSHRWKIIERDRGSPWPRPRRGSAMCGTVESSVFVVHGGLDSSEEILSDTWLYHLHNESWVLLAENTNIPSLGDRSDQVAHWCTSDSLWVHDSGTFSNINALPMWTFSFESFAWMNVNSNLVEQTAMENQQMVGSALWTVNDTDLYLLSKGMPDNGTSPQTMPERIDNCCLWKYSALLNQWGKIDIQSNDPEMDVSSRCPDRAVASWVDDCTLWLLGNSGGQTASEASPQQSYLWMLDLKLSRWTRFNTSSNKYPRCRGQPIGEPPLYRAYPTAWTWQRTHFIFGGLSKDGSMNDLWSFRIGEAGVCAKSANTLLVSPVGVFFISLSGLCVLAFFAVGIVFFAKCLSGPRLKPPNHLGDKIRYSPIDTEDVFIT